MMAHNTMSQAKYGFVTKMITHMFQLLARTSIKNNWYQANELNVTTLADSIQLQEGG
jgi:hypothetical protein